MIPDCIHGLFLSEQHGKLLRQWHALRAVLCKGAAVCWRLDLLAMWLACADST